jgi:hypothetical protein
MDGRVTLLVQPLPGLRLMEDGKTEEGSIIALRREGDECLYVPWSEKGMCWIPIGEFSVDPAAVTPIDLLEEPSEEEPTEPAEGISEIQAHKTPFGGRPLKRREMMGG